MLHVLVSNAPHRSSLALGTVTAEQIDEVMAGTCGPRSWSSRRRCRCCMTVAEYSYRLRRISTEHQEHHRRVAGGRVGARPGGVHVGVDDAGSDTFTVTPQGPSAEAKVRLRRSTAPLEPA